MKRNLLHNAVIAMALSLAFCLAPLQQCYAEETHVITDTMGRKVELKKDIKKIIAIPWPWTSFIFAVDGSADKIASMSATSLASYKNCMFEVLAPGLDKVDTGYIDDKNSNGGSFGTLNIEEMAKLSPDAVIIYKRDAKVMLPILEAAGVPTVVFDFGGLKEVQDGLILLGEMLGEKQSKTAETIINWHHEADALLKERLSGLDESKNPTVLMLRDGNLRLYLSGFSNNMMQQAGARLATLTPEGKVVSEANINFEQMLRWDPDYILLGNFADHTPDQIYENIMANQDWSSLKAVRNKHVYKIPMGLYRWDPPSTEAHLLLLWEAKMFHPELFRDIDLEQKTREFYKTIFDHELTRQELDMIFHADLNAHSEPIR
ncbi:MAG: ABC transporter substrate-binding protein [Mailhella sp.]|nr:ABC transporter substrate-binding protein [Mailhella sp.]